MPGSRIDGPTNHTNSHLHDVTQSSSSQKENLKISGKKFKVSLPKFGLGKMIRALFTSKNKSGEIPKSTPHSANRTSNQPRTALLADRGVKVTSPGKNYIQSRPLPKPPQPLVLPGSHRMSHLNQLPEKKPNPYQQKEKKPESMNALEKSPSANFEYPSGHPLNHQVPLPEAVTGQSQDLRTHVSLQELEDHEQWISQRPPLREPADDTLSTDSGYISNGGSDLTYVSDLSDLSDASTINSGSSNTLSETLPDVAGFLSSAVSSLSKLPAELNQSFQDPEKGSKVAIQFKDLQRISNLKTIPLDKKLNTQPEFYDEAMPKYDDIACHADHCAAPGNFFHATHIDMPNGQYIAAQGAVTKTHDNFIRLLNENDSPVSVALVNSDDMIYKRGEKKGQEKNLKSIGPTETGKPMTIPELKSKDGKVIAQAVTIELMESIELPDTNFRIDHLKLNGKTHFRINEMGWKDHTAGNPARLATLSVLTEKLRQHAEVKDREQKPIVVNCSAGVGRTGTFITTNDSTRSYLQSNGQYDKNVDTRILNARERRNAFVQNAGQYNTLQTLHNDLGAALDPIIEALGMKPDTAANHETTDGLSDISRSSSTEDLQAEESIYGNNLTIKLDSLSKLVEEGQSQNNNVKNETELKQTLSEFTKDEIAQLIKPGSLSLDKHDKAGPIYNKALTLLCQEHGRRKASDYLQQNGDSIELAKQQILNDYSGDRVGNSYDIIKLAALEFLGQAEQAEISRLPEAPSPTPPLPPKRAVDAADTRSISSSDSEPETPPASPKPRKKPILTPRSTGISPAQITAGLNVKVSAETVLSKLENGKYSSQTEFVKDLSRIQSNAQLNILRNHFEHVREEGPEENSTYWKNAVSYVDHLINRNSIPGAQSAVDQVIRNQGDIPS